MRTVSGLANYLERNHWENRGHGDYMKTYILGTPIPVTALGSATARVLRFWVRIPPGAWMAVSCERCWLSGMGRCVGLITSLEES